MSSIQSWKNNIFFILSNGFDQLADGCYSILVQCCVESSVATQTTQAPPFESGVSAAVQKVTKIWPKNFFFSILAFGRI